MTTTTGTGRTQPPRAAATGRRLSRQGGSGGYRISYGRWWWAVPAVVLMLAMIYATTATGAFYAFTNWTGIGSFDFVGLKNFTTIFSTPELTGALVNTLLLAVGFLVLTNVIGMLFALALNAL